MKSFITLCLIFLLVGPLAVKAEGIYRVNNIKVSVVSINAKKAKIEAIDKAQIEAFKELTQGAALPDEFYIKNKTEILGAAHEYQIISESIAKSSYSGTFDVYFSKSHVNDLLNQAGASSSSIDTESSQQNKSTAIANVEESTAALIKRKLIIPICSLEGKMILWDDKNPWLNQWKTRIDNAEEKSFIIPLGDLEDINDTKFNPLLANYKSFTRILERYEADEILIALAEIKKSRGAYRLSISMKVLTNNHEHTYLKQYFELSGATETEILSEAFYRVLSTDTGNQFDVKNLAIQISDNFEVEALFNLSEFAEWSALSRTLEKVPSVKKVSLMEFDGQTIFVSIIFKSNLEDFRKNLSKRGYSLADVDKRFIIKKG